MEWLGLFVGFFGGAIFLSIWLLISSTKWWHRRYHKDGLRIFSCDICYKIHINKD